MKEVNGHRENATNLNVTEGDNVTIIARAVGNVSFIYTNVTSGLHGTDANERFICQVTFLCDRQYSDDLNSRIQHCSLTNVNLSDNGTTIKFFIDNNIIELVEVNISGKWIRNQLFACEYVLTG